MRVVPNPSPPRFSIIISSWHTPHLVDACLESIEAHRGSISLEIIVVNDGSSSSSFHFLKEKYPSMLLIEFETNRGLEKAWNAALSRATGELLFFLNCDTVVPEGTLEAIEKAFLVHTDLGLLACHEVSVDGKTLTTIRKRHSMRSAIAHMTGYRIFKAAGRNHTLPDWDRKTDRWVDNFHGFAWAVRAKLLRDLGGIDEKFDFFFLETDLSSQIEKAGWRILYHAAARVIHIGGQSSLKMSVWKLRRKWVKSFVYYRQKHQLSVHPFRDTLILFPFQVVWWIRGVVNRCRGQMRSQKSVIDRSVERV